MLLERFKLDINTIAENAGINFELEIEKDFYYIVLEEKTVEDYPIVNLKSDESGLAKITCEKENDSITYTFRNNELESINHTILDNDTKSDDYYVRYNTYQNKVTNYNNLSGISGTFNGTLSGFSAIIAIDLFSKPISIKPVPRCKISLPNCS